MPNQIPYPFFIALIVSVGFAGAPVGGPLAAASERPNVIVFLVDDMGVMDTSVPFLTDADGNPKRYPLNEYYRTPHMQQLAKTGVRFNQFYAMSVCSPSRVSLLTGQNAARHHVTNWISPESNNGGALGPPDWQWEGLTKQSETLPRVLQDAGYRTIHIGKAHFGPRGFEGAEPLNLGFDRNIAGCSIGAPGSYFAKDNFDRKPPAKKTNPKNAKPRKSTAKKVVRIRAVPGLEKYHGSDIHLTEALTIEAKREIDEAVADEKPFFLHLSHYAVHSPHQNDPRFAENYRESGMSPQAQSFATLVEGMDQSLGAVLDHVREIGVAENTLVIFLGDNGTDAPMGHQHAVACAAPLRGKKGSHYEGGMRVPFMMSWVQPSEDSVVQRSRRIASSTIQPAIANICDVAPTIAELVGVSMSPDHVMDGSSLWNLTDATPDPDHADDFLMHYPHGVHRSSYFTTYRDGDWKVAFHYHPTDDSENQSVQLFDLAQDPFEQEDVARSQPDIAAEMIEKMAAKLESCHALYALEAADHSAPVRPSVPADLGVRGTIENATSK